MSGVVVLPDVLERLKRQDLSQWETLALLCAAEIARREERRMRYIKDPASGRRVSGWVNRNCCLLHECIPTTI